MINYSRLERSINYYTHNNFNKIETPWAIKHNTIDNKNEFLDGEQFLSFLQLKGLLTKGKYQTVVTYLYEDKNDFNHIKYFLKNELIIVGNATQAELFKLVNICKKYFEIELKNDVLLTKLDGKYTLTYNSVLLGEYYIKSINHILYIYGTGLIEPTFNFLKK